MYNGKEVNICIPTLNNYNGLENMIRSIQNGTVLPDNYYIIDNGSSLSSEYIKGYCLIIRPSFNLGVAASWNWFIENVPEYRIILNDDLVFLPNTLESFLAGMSDDHITSVRDVDKLNSYSFFSLPDSVVAKVGTFDAEFYPAYFEDNDYDYRHSLAGLSRVAIPLLVMHAGSQTLKNYNSRELEQHHQNFRKNQGRYKNKWGGLPNAELYTTPFNIR